MTEIWNTAAVVSAVAWICMALLPWQPWRNREALEPAGVAAAVDLSDVTVVIPARNEAEVIGATLAALAAQGRALKAIVVDDGSSDGTGNIAHAVEGLDLRVVTGLPLPEGWSGKLWALEQGAGLVNTPITLLLDADILLKPGVVAALRQKMYRDGIQFVSIMASLQMEVFWEKLLMPAFIYFFKQLYPFALANSRFQGIAAAAGGCIMLETHLLREMGGFGAIRGALIDDCSLAAKIKALDCRTWIGLSRAVHSLRPYPQLTDTWEMVARTAFTQLRYSPAWLAFCTLGILLMFVGPPVGALAGGAAASWWGVGWALMALLYLPTLRYYDRNPLWSLAMPAIATLYLAMTWSSAWRCWRGRRSRWKGRTYT